MQILPDSELYPFIRHYLFLESKQHSVQKLRLFSDGSMGVVFSFKRDLAKNDTRADFLPNSFLYGQISSFNDVYLLHETDLVIVVFQPSGVTGLLGIHAGEVRDNILSTEYVFGKQSKELYENLMEKSTIKERLILLNTFFLRLAAKRTPKNDSLLKASLNFIVKNNGLISSIQLVKFTGYTERHIERMFGEQVGINPKKFSNIIRLHYFLKQLKASRTNQNLTEMAYDAGYADQSHLIKQFKKFTGMAPATYLNKTDKITVNFVKFIPE
jgi:AraC-like DNA-binding protein